MKKLIIALALTLSCVAFSQEKRGQNENRENKSPEERTEKQLKKMTTDLSLDEKQVVVLRELLTNQSKKRQEKLAAYQTNKEIENTMPQDDKKVRVAEIKKNQAEMKGKMKEILNANQYTKWEKSQEDKREKMIEKIKERRSEN